MSEFPNWIRDACLQRTVFNVETDIYLMQDNPQIVRLRIRNHDELERRWRFVVVQFVVTSPIGYEASPYYQYLGHIIFLA